VVAFIRENFSVEPGRNLGENARRNRGGKLAEKQGF
jgi:hypothetical protein